MSTYLVLDIETISDNTLWTPPPEPPPEIPKIKLEKKPSKDSLLFLDEVMTILKSGSPVHADDLDKALDIATRAQMYDLDKALDATARAQLPEHVETLKSLIIVPEEKPYKPPFAPIHAHVPIAIGCVWLDSNLQAKKVGCMKIGNGGERELLMQWNDFMNQHKPTVVSWYGRGFDMPVLMLRSFRHGIPMHWYFGDKNYRYRYSEDKNADLCDVMSDFGATRNLKLDAVSQLIGLPGKHDDVDGSQVQAMYDAGKLEEIATYCTDDTVQTAFVYLRWWYTKGHITITAYREGVQSIISKLQEMPDMQSLLKLIKMNELLLLDPKS